MNSILIFFSTIVLSFRDVFHSMEGGAVIFALAVFFINISFINRAKDNIFISMVLEREFQDYIKKQQKKREVSAETKFLMNKGYVPSANTSVFISKMIFCLLFAYSCQTSYIAEVSTGIFNVEFSYSILKIFTQKAEINIYFALIVITAVVLQGVHNALLDNNAVVERRGFTLLNMLVVGLSCILFPAGFAIIWMLHTFMEVAFFAVCLTLAKERNMKHAEMLCGKNKKENKELHIQKKKK